MSEIVKGESWIASDASGILPRPLRIVRVGDALIMVHYDGPRRDGAQTIITRPFLEKHYTKENDDMGGNKHDVAVEPKPETNGGHAAPIEKTLTFLQIEAAQVENWFSYHSPTPDQLPKYAALRESAKAFATKINELCPPSADRSAAIRKLREAVMTANASIACGGK